MTQSATGTLTMNGRVTRGQFTLNVELTAHPGELVAVVGPNGSGKTSLLRTLAGLERLTSGEITFGDHVLDDGDRQLVPATERGIGLAFQDHRLFPRMSVLDNVAFPLRAAGMNRGEARARAHEALVSAGLSTWGAAQPPQLSGGQSLRAALARALVAQPRALLLDEPSAALDPASRESVRNDIRQYSRSFAGPIVMVTHDPVEALTLADRVVVLEAGRVTQSAPPAEIVARPATAYIAGLVGVNWYEAVRSDRHRVALRGGGEWEVSASGCVGERVHLIVAPTAISLHRHEPELPSRNRWEAHIREINLVGGRVRAVASGHPSAAIELHPSVVAGKDLCGPVWLSVAPGDVTVSSVHPTVQP